MPTGAKGQPGAVTREIASIFRAALARKQWTQGRLADEARTSQSTVSKILRGDGHIDIEQLYAISGALDLSAIDVVDEAERVAQARQGSS